MIAARLEHRQLTAAIDLEIGVRIAHAVDVTDLASEIEDDVPPGDEIVHRRLLADVGDVDAHPISDAIDVEQVAAVIRNERVDQQHVCAERDELPRQIAADESEAAGNHDRSAAVELAVVHGHDCGGVG